MRKLIGILGLAFVVAVFAIPVASASTNGGQHRARYQLRPGEATTLLTQPATR
jgi:hypothetical protein